MENENMQNGGEGMLPTPEDTGSVSVGDRVAPPIGTPVESAGAQSVEPVFTPAEAPQAEKKEEKFEDEEKELQNTEAKEAAVVF